MTDKEKQDVEKLLTTIKIMRTYQNRFFGGDKSALKNAKYWENQADNDIQRVIVDHKLTVTLPKGPSAQGKLI